MSTIEEKQLAKIRNDILYYEKLRNTIVNLPISNLGGYVPAAAMTELVVDKLNSLHERYRLYNNGEDFPWNTEEGKLL